MSEAVAEATVGGDNRSRRVIKSLRGVVVSDAMDKSRTLRIARRVKHPTYRKYLRRTSKIIYHDEGNVSRVGDEVMIQPCRPRSKRKSFELMRVLHSASSAATAVPAGDKQ
ncbi:MAG: 30S ribosomal protein S17 [Pseudomonadota bacterium]|nr:30S ribosomal protein S17 [Pseudomonadota bacterium]